MPKRIAVAGATGDVGLTIVSAFLSNAYTVTALTRQGPNNSSRLPRHDDLQVVEVDYTSVPSMTRALKDTFMVVSTLTTAFVGDQIPLIDAAVAAGVKRFIPSEYGSDVYNAKRNALPVFAGKVKTHEHLKKVAAANPDFSYTIICCGPFLDWSFNGFVLNVPEHSAVVYNGGNVRYSTANLDSVGRAVVNVVRKFDDTANRPVYIQDAIVTQNEMIQYAKDKDGKEWDLVHKSTDDMYDAAMKELAKGNTDFATMMGFIFSAGFGEGYGLDFSDHLDNELLGIEGLNKDGVRAVVERYLK
ncbi:hypothetical protein H2204_014461 [Knufia peltigerae]|uniref:NmrA-like domain-containing protein n=1 Tax=Knufia peltigerae TaxID=1002370 RepID=A0AA38XJR5_9EURO|nr:hypothetical protein H2204_014461 [Knufia peltigerae]